jgi:pyruvate,water dikinase
MGLDSAIVMIPFCGIPGEADKVPEVLAQNGLERDKKGLQLSVMAEIPSNIILAPNFWRHFDDFFIHSNDLMQLVAGVCPHSAELSYFLAHQHKAAKDSTADLISSAHRKKRKLDVYGQAPSDHPEFAASLAKPGINSIPIKADSVLAVIEVVAKLSKRRAKYVQ